MLSKPQTGQLQDKPFQRLIIFLKASKLSAHSDTTQDYFYLIKLFGIWQG